MSLKELKKIISILQEQIVIDNDGVITQAHNELSNEDYELLKVLFGGDKNERI